MESTAVESAEGDDLPRYDDATGVPLNDAARALVSKASLDSPATDAAGAAASGVAALTPASSRLAQCIPSAFLAEGTWKYVQIRLRLKPGPTTVSSCPAPKKAAHSMQSLKEAPAGPTASDEEVHFIVRSLPGCKYHGDVYDATMSALSSPPAAVSAQPDHSQPAPSSAQRAAVGGAGVRGAGKGGTAGSKTKKKQARGPALEPAGVDSAAAAGGDYDADRLTGTVVGGGRIVADSVTKKVSIYGYSKTFGRSAGCNERSANIVRQSPSFLGYTVTWSDEGY